jgi:hypothetical protein
MATVETPVFRPEFQTGVGFTMKSGGAPSGYAQTRQGKSFKIET